MSRSVDFLIVGGGLAGHTLQIELERRGKSTLVIDRPDLNASSVIAAGMANPIAGKFFNVTWRAKDIYPELASYYKQLESELGAEFFTPSVLKRVFSQAGEQNNWLAKSKKAKYEPYCSFSQEEMEGLKSPFGVLEIRKGGQMNVRNFLNACKKKFDNLSESFDHEALDIQGKRYKDIVFENIVFAEGLGALSNPLFDTIPLVPMKGELIEIETDLQPVDEVLMGPVFLQYVEGRTWRVGATYEPKATSLEPTEEKRLELTTKLEKFLDLPYTIVRQYAGVRPASIDRRPIIGAHPLYHHAYVFNGFGSKGITLIPIHAKELVKFVLDGEPLHPEVILERFEVSH